MDAVKLLGSLMGNNATGGNLMGSLLGQALGGGSGSSGGGLGALAGLLGGAAGGGGGGGLGALAGMLGGAGGQNSGAAQAGSGGGLGGLLSSMAQGQAQPQQAQPQEQEQATVLVRAMCNAAKADGQIDQSEVQNIMGRLGEVDQAEAEFLKAELQAPLDVQGFVQQVPRDMAEQAYAFSLMGMKLDSQQEAKYLGAVAQGLGLNPQVCNQIHAKLGAPEIFK